MGNQKKEGGYSTMLMFYLSLFETEDEKQSFSQFYERVKFKCLRVAMSITKDQALAEDAIHNAFMKVIGQKEEFFALPCYKQDSRIVIMVKNKAIDILRSYKKLTENIADEAVASDYDLDSEYENVESYEELKNLIKKLPDIYRVVFEMRHIQDLDNSEIAEVLDVTKDVVAMRLNRAKKKLIDMIKESSALNDR